jgi:hypothetical protein
MAPAIMFLNGPAYNGFNANIWGMWGLGYVPGFTVDGVNNGYGWNQTTWTNYVNSRLAVPAIIEILPVFTGNASGGSVTYNVTAESNPGTGLKLYSAILESGHTASSSYGLYSGQVLAYEPFEFPCGTTGTSISFTGPYPQTVQVTRSYTIDPTVHVFDNLTVTSFVINSGQQVLNGHYMDLPDTATGTYGTSHMPVEAAPGLEAGPNPTYGSFTVTSVLPGGQTGTVTVYDLSGRAVESFPAGGSETLTIEESGLYLVRLITGSGLAADRQITVIR